MKVKTKLLLLVMTLAFALTGCAKYNSTVLKNEDGRIAYRVSQSNEGKGEGSFHGTLYNVAIVDDTIRIYSTMQTATADSGLTYYCSLSIDEDTKNKIAKLCKDNKVSNQSKLYDITDELYYSVGTDCHYRADDGVGDKANSGKNWIDEFKDLYEIYDE